MSFTDGKPRIVTPEDLSLRWGCAKPGQRFRCTMCGHRFEVGDVWRFVYTNGLKDGRYGGNPIVCEPCDGPDVIERWKKLCDEAYSDKFWWFLDRE
jgi:formate-dependent nitrite reductase cytochrome c552 subunit